MKKIILIGIVALGLILILAPACSKAKPSMNSGNNVPPPISSPTTSASTIPSSTVISQPSLTPGPSPETTSGLRQNVLPLDVTEPVDSAVLTNNLVTVRGRTAPGATVSVNDGIGKADGNGNFNVMIDLEEGIDAIDIIAMNADGDEAEVILLVTVDLSNTVSALSTPGNVQGTAGVNPGSISLKVISPADGSDIDGDVVTVKGQTEPGAVVNVNDETDIADDGGNFSISISLEVGLNAIDVFVTDEDGNQVEELILVNSK
jgi:hypothetical protein